MEHSGQTPPGDTLPPRCAEDETASAFSKLSNETIYGLIPYKEGYVNEAYTFFFPRFWTRIRVRRVFKRENAEQLTLVWYSVISDRIILHFEFLKIVASSELYETW